jgi:cytochrome bd-type quinol oxidase subunit 2
MKRKKLVSWLVLLALLAVYLELLHLAGKYIAPHVDASFHWVVGPAERSHPILASTLEIAAFIGLLAFFIVLVMRREKVLDARRTSEEDWLWIVFGILALVALMPLIDFVFPRTPSKFAELPLVHLTTLRIQLICGLIALGTALYLFKRRSRIAFGAAEIVLAILTNRALLVKLDLSTFPRLQISSTDLIAFGAMAFLLSQGITDIADGVKIVRDRRLLEKVDEGPRRP